MGKMKSNLVTGILGILLFLNAGLWPIPSNVGAQAQQWFQAEQMRQAYQRQQWLQWQRQEQIRQKNERQQLLQWQQQERLRQILQK